MTTPTPRPGIMDISPYQGGKSNVEGVDRIIKLASNEGALGPSPKAVAAHEVVSGGLHRYPDGGSTDLRVSLAEKYGLDADRIVLGAGSDEILTLITRAYAGPGDEVLYPEHGFLMYPIAAKGVGAVPVTAAEDGMTLSVDNLLAAVTEKTKIVFLANPNNPTGTWVAASEIERLRAGLPDHVVLVLDGAYAEFMDADDAYDAGAKLVDSTDNTVMTRTFSKIYGLGGLRLGWGYFPAGIADVMNRLRNPFNVTLSAQATGVAALEDDAFVEKVRVHTSDLRAWFSGHINQIEGLTAHPSVCNFVLVEFPDADAANSYMMSRGVIPRKVASYGLPNMLRITIGTREEMEICLQIIRDYMRSA